MRTILKRVKSELKAEGKAIREAKKAANIAQRSTRPSWSEQAALVTQRSKFRHKHIAYCESRGTPRELIEHPGEDNKPDESQIKRIKAGWEKEAEKLEDELFEVEAA